MIELPTTHIAILIMDLHIPESNSLKSKRHVIKSIKDRLRAKFNASIAELGELDKWQRSVVGAALIGNDKRKLNESAEAIVSFVVSAGTVQLLESHLELL